MSLLLAIQGPTYSLELIAGSYTLSGNDVGLYFNRRVNAEAGSYLLSGEDVSLKYNRVLGAEQGTYNLAGSDVGLLFNRRLIALSGTYTLNGVPVDLEFYNRLISLGQGSYVLTGREVILKQIFPSPLIWKSNPSQTMQSVRSREVKQGAVRSKEIKRELYD